MGSITVEDFLIEVKCDCGECFSYKANAWRELYEAAIQYYLMIEGQTEITDEIEKLRISGDMGEAIARTKLSNHAEWREAFDRAFSELKEKLQP